MKQIIQYFDELPTHIAEQAKFNSRHYPYEFSGKIVTSLKSALLHGFIWGCTEQGCNYWTEIFKGNYPKQNKLL